VGSREPSALDLKFKATTALPYDHLEQATGSPGAELREQVAAAQAGEPDRAMLAVDGPGKQLGLTVSSGASGEPPFGPYDSIRGHDVRTHPVARPWEFMPCE
jgi:hypothetical protein